MSDPAVSPQPTLTDHDRAAAQTQEVQGDGESLEAVYSSAGRFCVGPRVRRAQEVRSYVRDPEKDPLYRNLRIYTRDPTLSTLEGAVATLKIPYEPLPTPGPRGKLFHVVEREMERRGKEVNLDD